jgi:hypothetical protein
MSGGGIDVLSLEGDGIPTPFLETDFYEGTLEFSQDGQRFVMIVPAESEPVAHELILVQNWTEELKRRVPAN